jgi:hypothetical protein
MLILTIILSIKFPQPLMCFRWLFLVSLSSVFNFHQHFDFHRHYFFRRHFEIFVNILLKTIRKNRHFYRWPFSCHRPYVYKPLQIYYAYLKFTFITAFQCMEKLPFACSEVGHFPLQQLHCQDLHPMKICPF